MPHVLNNVIHIFKEELDTIFHDKGIILIMAGAVLLYSLIYMVPYHNHIARDIDVAVIDSDNSNFSRKLIRAFQANEMMNVKIHVNSLSEAQKEYYKDNIKAYLHIPVHFERDIKRGKPVYISAYLDSSYLVLYKQIATGLNEISSTLGASLEVNTLMKKGMSKKKASIVKSPFNLVGMPLYNPSSSYQNYIYPQVLIMILQQTMLMGISLLMGTLYENLVGIYRRDKGKNIVFYKQDTISFVTENPVEIVLGKGFAYFTIYFCYACLFLFVLPVFVNYRTTEHFISALIYMIPFLFSTAFLGITFISFCRYREYGMLFLVPSSVPFIFLPGFVWAREGMPFLLRLISTFIPTTNGIRGLVKINQMGATLYDIFPDFIEISFLAIFYFFIAVFCIKNTNKKFKEQWS